MTELRFTGVGGQGVLLAGEILAEAKIKDSGYGVKAATYTSQVRGGPTKVDILLDEEEILYPYAQNIDFMLSTAQISFDQFKKDIKENAIVVVETNLVKPAKEDYEKYKIYSIPIITIAKEEVGVPITQSIVALAITVSLTKCVNKEVVYNTMLSKVPKKMADVNKKAFELGEKYALKAIA